MGRPNNYLSITRQVLSERSLRVEVVLFQTFQVTSFLKFIWFLWSWNWVLYPRQVPVKFDFVTNLGDVPRVDGQLAVARAFGDKSLKMHLSSDPYVTMELIDDNAEFLILASDGLWKVRFILNLIFVVMGIYKNNCVIVVSGHECHGIYLFEQNYFVLIVVSLLLYRTLKWYFEDVQVFWSFKCPWSFSFCAFNFKFPANKENKLSVVRSSQVMTNEEAVNCVRHIKDARAAAKQLTEEALNRKSSDDISCIVVRFQWWKERVLLFGNV